MEIKQFQFGAMVAQVPKNVNKQIISKFEIKFENLNEINNDSKCPVAD